MNNFFYSLAAVFILVVIAFSFTRCYNEEDSKRVLENAGYTDIEIKGRAYFMCSEDDTYATAFQATAPNGRSVTGAVCCGFVGKACTIRFD